MRPYLLKAATLDRRHVLLLLAGSILCVATRPVFAAAALGMDRNGQPVQSLADAHTKVVVAIFVATDCPISNRYLPEIARLSAEFSTQGARFWLVYPNPSDDLAAVHTHQAAYTQAALINTLIAPSEAFIREAGVHVTPEAALFDSIAADTAPALWHGPIDDRYLTISRQRTVPAHHDLAVAIRTALSGKRPGPAIGHPVGCTILRRL